MSGRAPRRGARPTGHVFPESPRASVEGAQQDDQRGPEPPVPFRRVHMQLVASGSELQRQLTTRAPPDAPGAARDTTLVAGDTVENGEQEDQHLHGQQQPPHPPPQDPALEAHRLGSAGLGHGPAGAQAPATERLLAHERADELAVRTERLKRRDTVGGRPGYQGGHPLPAVLVGPKDEGAGAAAAGREVGGYAPGGSSRSTYATTRAGPDLSEKSTMPMTGAGAPPRTLLRENLMFSTLLTRRALLRTWADATPAGPARHLSDDPTSPGANDTPVGPSPGPSDRRPQRRRMGTAAFRRTRRSRRSGGGPVS